MKLKQTILLAVLLIAGCISFDPARYPTGHRPGDTGLPSDKAPYKRWKIYFYYPKGLEAMTNEVVVYNKSARLYHFRLGLGFIEQDKNSVGGWYNKMKYFDNHHTMLSMDNQLPLNILFCWTSFVDHKVYQTEIQFSPALWQKMQTQADHPDRWGKPFWYDTLMIGLAPEGKIKVWLQDHNEEYPNIPVTPVTTTTRSDEQIVCYDLDREKGIQNPEGLDYTSEETEEFMKGKTYPYGNW